MNARTLPSETDPNTVLRYVDLSTVKEGRLVDEPAVVRFADAPSRARRRLAAGDSIVSTVRPQLRGMAFFAAAEPDLVVSTGFAVLSPQSDVDPAFLFQNVRRQEFTDFLCTRMKGSNYPAVNASDVADAPLLLPPLPEQRRIAAVLQAADDAVAAAEAVIDQTEKVKRGLVEQLLTRGMPGRHKRFKMTEIGEVPESWEVLSLGVAEGRGLLAGIQDGNHGEKHPKAADYVKAGIPFLMARDLVEERVDLSTCEHLPRELADALRIGFARPGDVLLTHKGTVGSTAIVPDVPDYVMLSPQVTYYRVGRAADLLPTYLLNWFRQPRFQRLLDDRARQSTRSYIGITEQRKLPLALPPLAEQQAIVEVMEESARALGLSRASTAAERSLGRGLAGDLLSGRVRVPA